MPTTIDVTGKSLYAVNARFGTNPDPTTTYSLVQIRALRDRVGTSGGAHS